MKFLPVAVMAMAWTTYVVADEVKPFSYKGVRLGASLAEFKSAAPAFECGPDDCDYLMPICVGGRLTPQLQPGQSSRDACDAATSFGGVPIISGRAFAQDSQIGMINLTIHTREMDALAAAVTAAYGAPAYSIDKEVKNRAGATFQSWEKKWVHGSESMTLNKIAGAVDEGSAMLASDAYLKAKAAQRNEKAKAGSRDF